MVHKIAAFALAVGCFASGAAMACPKGNVQFNDQFATIDPGWSNMVAPTYTIDKGQLAVDLGPKTIGYSDSSVAKLSFNQSNLYTDGTYCMDFSFDAVGAANTFQVALVFWGGADDLFYGLNLANTGMFQVMRKVHQRYLYPIDFTATTALKPEANALQEVIVKTKGNVATFLINGTKVGEIKGQAPSNGGTIGLFAQVNSKDQQRVHVSQIQITD